MIVSNFTLVSTVFNEIRRLQQTIDDLEGQTLKPGQIIVTDAGSSDGTYEALLVWSETSAIEIVIFRKPGCNVAEGRNIAIRNARYDLIVSTDFGCRFHPEWLQSIIAPFHDVSVQVVGGAFTVDESAIVSLPSKANYVLTNGYKVVLDSSFIPSSRSIAYYKSVWQSVGGYCEWLTLAADDLVFGKAIKSKGYTITLVDKPYVFWGRHPSMKGYAKESFRYGLGDGEARVNVRNTISGFAELALRYLLFLLMVLFMFNLAFSIVNPLYFIAAVAFLPGLRSYHRAWRNWRILRSPKYNFKVFLCSLALVEFTRLNYLKGYVKGYFFSRKSVEEQARVLAGVLR